MQAKAGKMAQGLSGGGKGSHTSNGSSEGSVGSETTAAATAASAIPAAEQLTKRAPGMSLSATLHHTHSSSKMLFTQGSLSHIAKLEEEIMSESSSRDTKSDLLEKNLNQMVDVLHCRLKDLSKAAALRIQLSNDDPKGDQRTESVLAPRLGKETDEVYPKSGQPRSSHTRDGNLVASDVIHIDPVKLTFRTKNTTETAKRLEGKLDDTFGNISASMREMLGKKAKGTNPRDRDEAARLNEQNKSEAKRQLRIDLEKELFNLMENHVPRSILEANLAFKAPGMASPSTSLPTGSSNYDHVSGGAGRLAALPSSSSFSVMPVASSSVPPSATRAAVSTAIQDGEVQWPIPIKWPTRDPRSKNNANVEGEMNTELLLRYAIERLCFSSGETLFRRLVKMTIVQDYFVHLFWLIKVKLFRHASESEHDEQFLLHRLAALYSQLLTVIGARAHEENEKDFVFKYLPYILCNAVYFTLYFLCPGSRHLYTKSFRKTVYMQIIMIMFGVQLCPAAVKIDWARFFPEDVHEDDVSPSSSSSGSGAGAGSSATTAAAAISSNGIGTRDDPSQGSRGEHIPVSLAFTGARRAIDKVDKKMAELSTSAISTYKSLDRFEQLDLSQDASAMKRTSIDSSTAGAGVGAATTTTALGSTTTTTAARGFRGMLSGSQEDESLLLATQRAQSMAAAALLQPLPVINDNSLSASSSSLSKSAKGRVGGSTASTNAVIFGGTATAFNATTSNVNLATTPEASTIVRSRSLGGDSTDSPLDIARKPQRLTSSLRQLHRRLLQPMQSSVQLLKKIAEEEPLYRTHLLPLAERPRHYPNIVSHQIVDSMDSKGLSPLMQQYLKSYARYPKANSATAASSSAPTTRVNSSGGGGGGRSSSAGDSSGVGAPLAPIEESVMAIADSLEKQQHLLKRTMPVSWCRVGGADTYHRIGTSLSKERLEELSTQSVRASKNFRQESVASLQQRIALSQDIQDKYQKVLSSGSSRISKFAVDIVKQQKVFKGSHSRRRRKARDNKAAATRGMTKNGPATSTASVAAMVAAAAKSMKEFVEPQVELSVADITQAALLDKDDLLQDFLATMN